MTLLHVVARTMARTTWANALIDEVNRLADQQARWEYDDYTPAIAGITLGTGGTPHNTAYYTYVGGGKAGEKGILTLNGSVELGTTGEAVNFPSFSIPDAFTPLAHPSTGRPIVVGMGQVFDGGVATQVFALTAIHSSGTLSSKILTSNATYVAPAEITTIVPITWANSDGLVWNASMLVERDIDM